MTTTDTRRLLNLADRLKQQATVIRCSDNTAHGEQSALERNREAAAIERLLKECGASLEQAA